MSLNTDNATQLSASKSSPSSSPMDAPLYPMGESTGDYTLDPAYYGNLDNVADYHPSTSPYTADIYQNAAYDRPATQYSGRVNDFALHFPSSSAYANENENATTYYATIPGHVSSIAKTATHYFSTPRYHNAGNHVNIDFPSSPTLGAVTRASPVAAANPTNFDNGFAFTPDHGPGIPAHLKMRDVQRKMMGDAGKEKTSINDGYLLPQINSDALPADFPFEQFGLMKKMQDGMLSCVGRDEAKEKAGYDIFSANDILEIIKKEAQELDTREEALVRREIALREGEDKLEAEKIKMSEAKSATTIDTITRTLPQDKFVALCQSNSRHAKQIAKLNQVIRRLEYTMARDKRVLDCATQNMERVLAAVDLEETATVEKKELDPRSEEFKPTLSTPSYSITPSHSSRHASVIGRSAPSAKVETAADANDWQLGGLVVQPEEKDEGIDSRTEQAFIRGVGFTNVGILARAYGNLQNVVAGSSSDGPLSSHIRKRKPSMWMKSYGSDGHPFGVAGKHGKNTTAARSAGYRNGGYGNSQYGTRGDIANGAHVGRGAEGAGGGAKAHSEGAPRAGQAFNQGNNSAARDGFKVVNISGNCRR